MAEDWIIRHIFYLNQGDLTEKISNNETNVLYSIPYITIKLQIWTLELIIFLLSDLVQSSLVTQSSQCPQNILDNLRTVSLRVKAANKRTFWKLNINREKIYRLIIISIFISQNISILVGILYIWRICVNIKKYDELADVYYGKK